MGATLMMDAAVIGNCYFSLLPFEALILSLSSSWNCAIQRRSPNFIWGINMWRGRVDVSSSPFWGINMWKGRRTALCGLLESNCFCQCVSSMHSVTGNY